MQQIHEWTEKQLKGTVKARCSMCDAPGVFYLRWGFSTSYQPVFLCNYAVSGSHNASKDAPIMETTWAISLCLIRVAAFL